MHHSLQGDESFRGKQSEYLHKELTERIAMGASEIGKGVVVDGTYSGKPLIGGIVFR